MSVRELVSLVKRHSKNEIRAFLKWAQENADSPEYFDRVIRMVGPFAVTARRIWIAMLEAILRDDKEEIAAIAKEFWDGENKLARNVVPDFYRQVQEAKKFSDVVIGIEFGCGVARYTPTFAKYVLERGGLYFAYDQSPAAVKETRDACKLLGLTDSRLKIRRGSTDDIEMIMKGIYNPSHCYLFPDIRLDLHITQPERWYRFMHYIGKHGYRVLHAQTSADYLPPGRPRHKGTVFRTQAEVTNALNMVPVHEPKICDHHGDPIVITDYVHPFYQTRSR